MAASTNRPGRGRGTRLAIALDISGVTCESCAAHVRYALQPFPGVPSVEVSFTQSRARVTLEARYLAGHRDRRGDHAQRYGDELASSVPARRRTMPRPAAVLRAAEQ